MNGRNLDIRLRVPPGFEAVGEEVRKLVSALVTRGAVQVGLMVQRADARRVGVRINTEVLTSLAEALASLPPSLPFQPATLDGLLQVRGVVEVEDPDEQSLGGDLHPHLLACASRAADALAAARRHEGLALRDVLAAQLSRMTELVAIVENHPARSAASIRARLETQLSTLMTGRENALDPDRLYQEAALLATRADVREELDRLGAHIDASRELLEQGGAIGRKLDFLAQEFGREASTLCAKANHVELSRVGLELRAIVDQFREQAQNVE